ncbi:restriction endonuclease [Burkholderia sp. BKH01]|uniref:nSTAND1 domain-containing NTPase n=1 Tax=Burkholderia sp. BKH01 TaxID=2769262 RepID=UPI0021E00CD0|nr:restriction endonuclease [Burkholderia sp. BKH01]MCU9952784.1 restriction endonuclease [Burkholderia sp. BKH01]
MSDARHLLFSVPADWTNDDKGDFYEEFIVEILKPMRMSSQRRLRVSGMELDILAKSEDRPITVLVECKAHRDPVSADVITKLMGNVQLRRADHGWLFTTSDLTKDGRGLWEEIQQDRDLSLKFTWYSPARTIDVLIAQRSIVDPQTLSHHVDGFNQGDWSLVVTPGRRSWLVELLEEGIPAKYAVFNARNGQPLGSREAAEVAGASHRYAALQAIQLPSGATATPTRSPKAPVARVISGDAWEDPRPARPTDFVGRDEVISGVGAFIEQARSGATSTRSFAVLAPSGWGKSSLALKLVHKSGTSSMEKISITAVDSRSASNAGFVVEALRLALDDAVNIGAARKNPLNIHSLREPLDSPDVKNALTQLRTQGRIAVLMFDQFEELFAKESLFEVFNAVRDLSLDVDSAQAPLVLGFAWKTDVSLPQQHPAYHLWHQLADRRKTFKVTELKRGEIDRVISKAEKAIGKKLSRPLRHRLTEQCQGLPWLLKKLLVHVLQRVSTAESQYLLLERELDIEQLFKEDLEQLQEDHLRCLKFVAARAPVAVAEVEDSFSRDTTNLLINQHLLVRSGMNYVVYWDIFRDYLVEERVPQIPWTRTFQRTPPVALRALNVLESKGPLSALALGEQLSLKEGPTFNLLGDLVAFQLVDADGSGNYKIPSHLSDLSPTTIAGIVRSQLRRHVVARAIERLWARDEVVSQDDWLHFFDQQQPRSTIFSPATLRVYCANLKNWLLFAGLLELRPRGIARADGNGGQLGVVSTSKTLTGLFLGASSPARLQELLTKLVAGATSRRSLDGDGLRNAISDASALGLIDVTADRVNLRMNTMDLSSLMDEAKRSVARQPTIQLALESIKANNGDRNAAAPQLAEGLGAVAWKPVSALRYLGGLVRYANWAHGLSKSDHNGTAPLNFGTGG